MTFHDSPSDVIDDLGRYARIVSAATSSRSQLVGPALAVAIPAYLLVDRFGDTPVLIGIAVFAGLAVIAVVAVNLRRLRSSTTRNLR